MADLIPQDKKPQHREIHLVLLKMDVPVLKPDATDLRTALPQPVTISVRDGALLVRMGQSEHSIELRVSDIPRVTVDGWSNGFYRATVELRDPYEVVDHFNIVVGCEDDYWIKAFAKMCKDKLGLFVLLDEAPF